MATPATIAASTWPEQFFGCQNSIKKSIKNSTKNSIKNSDLDYLPTRMAAMALKKAEKEEAQAVSVEKHGPLKSYA